MSFRTNEVGEKDTRILSILEEAAQRLQLFILTCHPERYGGLAEAEFYDLEGIVGG